MCIEHEDVSGIKRPGLKLLIATLTISTSALGEHKAVGGVEREIDRGNYQSGQGTPGKLWKEGYGEGKYSHKCRWQTQPATDRISGHMCTCIVVYFHILAQ